MRKQFNLQDWLKDKSQRVETRDGRIVHDIWPVKEPLIVNGKRAEVCALIEGEEDALVFLEGGRYYPTTKETDSSYDLFIVTPEEELTEWEKAIKDLVLDIDEGELRKLGVFEEENLGAWAVKKAAELLSLAIDARAKELSEGLKQSELDKDSIPYHLIEFMCNLYDSQNWKEIEDTAELYVTRFKAAALKDLPRWKKKEEDGLFGYYCSCGFLVSDGYEISINELKRKLPRVEEE